MSAEQGNEQHILDLIIVIGHEIARGDHHSQVFAVEEQHQLGMHHPIAGKLGKGRDDECPVASILSSQ